jgi:hypothetical protein
MNHLNTHEHAFIVNNRINQILVFDEDKHGTDFLEQVKSHFNADDIICLCDYFDRTGVQPGIHWSWDGTTFTAPTIDYLYSIGVVNENQAMRDARIAAENNS